MRIACLMAALLLTTACTPTPTPETPAAAVAQAAESRPEPMVVGMANPAAVACGDLFGGELSMVETPEGQTGMCTLPDGRVCEEWELFREHRCAVNHEGPTIGEPVLPRPQTEPRRHSRSGKTGG